MNCIPPKGPLPLRSGWAAVPDPAWARPPVKVTRVPKPAAAAASGPDSKAARCPCTAGCLSYATVNVERLEVFEDGAVVDAAALLEKKIIRKELAGVKILGVGELTKKLTVKAAKFSATAKEKIEAVGGKAEVI